MFPSNIDPIVTNFLYFAYGSNMFTFRLNMNTITAEFISIARLDDYRLDFIRFSKFWGGPTATVVPTANAHVWGVVWRVALSDIETLDDISKSSQLNDLAHYLRQEGVERKIYYPKHVEVLTPHMGTFKCRIYIQKINPLPIGDNDAIPAERWPSWTYKEVIILGAMEHELPKYYIKKIEKLKDNGEKGCFKMYSLLLRYIKCDPCPCEIHKKIQKPSQLDLRKNINKSKKI